VVQKDCVGDEYLGIEVDAHRHLLYVPQGNGTVDVVGSRTGRVRKVHVLRRPGRGQLDILTGQVLTGQVLTDSGTFTAGCELEGLTATGPQPTGKTQDTGATRAQQMSGGLTTL
jgi:hypothetical protein